MEHACPRCGDTNSLEWEDLYGWKWVRRCRLCNAAFLPDHARSSRKDRNRLRVLDRDGPHCAYCEEDFRDHNYKSFTLDHVIPKARGGSNHWSNLVLACGTCNRNKGHTWPVAMAPHVAPLFVLEGAQTA